MMKKIYDEDINWNGLIDQAKDDYKFQPLLTQKLDNHTGDFTEMTILEIVLWKTNRYPEFSQELLDEINQLRQVYSVDKAKVLLGKLLKLKGFDLPMASTVLRFACPNELQIIDQRVYRFITKDADVFKKPYSDEKKVEMYFDYIQRLREVCNTYGITFEQSDRVLYQLDKQFNKKNRIQY